MKDEGVVQLLTSMHGIGRWAAEMSLIFYLGRENIMSFGDRGLCRAMEWLYELDKNDGISQLQRKHVE